MVARVRTQPTIADSAFVGIWRDSLEVFALTVSPESTFVETDEAVQLSAEAQLANGAMSQAEPLTWAADGGQVSTDGAFVAAEEGRYTVRAAANNGVVSAALVVVKRKTPVIIGISVTPATVTLAPGAPQQFHIQGALSTGGTSGADVVWSAAGGTINSGGLYVAGSRPGTYSIIARLQQGTAADTSIVTISSLTVTQVIVSPGSATVAPGSALRFSATAKRSDGSTAPVTPTWEATGGSVNSSGVFAAGATTGAYRVIATVAGVADTAPVVIKQSTATLNSIVLNPSSSSVAGGQARDFTVTASWSDGSTTVPPITWTAAGGTMAAGGRYTAGTVAGTYTVIAAANGKADTAAVTVTSPVLKSIAVSPGSGSVLPGQALQFSVTGALSDGSSNVPAVTWSAGSGTITTAGLYTAATTAGTFNVIATAVGGLADTAYVTVSLVPVTLTSLTVVPATATLAPGAGKAFAVQPLWSNSTTTLPAVTWTATGGTITNVGYYVAGPVAGSFRVVAASNGKADTAAVTVTAPTTLTSITISPKSATLNPAGQLQFSATALWSNGTTTLPQISWIGTGGAVTSSGLYTAGSVGGTYRLIAASAANGRADTATVTVNAPTSTPTLKAVVLSPSMANTLANGLVQFSAVGQFTDGSLQAIPITWTVQGGSISSGGLYSAGTAVGTYRVIAAGQGGPFADTAMVTVNPVTSGFPASYDPARLGSALLVGQSWQGLNIGSDSGYSAIINVGAFRQATNPYPTPVQGELMVDLDPTFGKVVRMVQPDYHAKKFASTVEGYFQFQPTAHFWYRAVIKVSGNGNQNGALGTGFTAYGTGVNGGSTTYKMMFAWPNVGSPPDRMQWELYNGGQFVVGIGNGEPGRVETRLVQTVGTPAAPAVGMLGTWINGAEFRTNGDWYEFVMNYEKVSATEYIQRYFIRRLTVSGVWNPWPNPAWAGYRITGGKSFDYATINLGGNKSQSNDGPFDQYLWWGPFEVTNAADPYGWDRYGK